MKFAITPCPNDTFSYEALISKKIKSDFDFVFSDIEELNISAEKGEYPITKLSFPAYLRNADKYELMDAGAALGIGTGPVLVSKVGTNFDVAKPVIVPGINTTATLLLKFYAGKNLKLIPAYFRDISRLLSEGVADSGVLIHEGRFVYESEGLNLSADLGSYWTEKTGLPVPLGCICIRKDFAHLRKNTEMLIRESIKAGFDNPEAIYPYVASMAQYLASDVLQKHIFAFVNDYSYDISSIRNDLLEHLISCM